MPSTLVVAGAAFLGGMATSSIAENSTKSRILAHTKTGAMLATSTLAARKKMSGGVGYDRGFAKGYAECKSKYAAADAAGGVRIVPMPMRLQTEPGFADGYNAGWQKCLNERRSYPSVPVKITVRNDDEPKHWYNW